MRFDSSTKPPSPLPWRLILWAVTLVPALVILLWTARQAAAPKRDPALAGRTSEEAARLQRILSEPRDDRSSALRDDAVRLVDRERTGLDSTDPSDPSEAAGKTAASALFDKSMLSDVEDNTFGVTRAEKPAYDAVLAKARDVPQAELQRLARTDVPFAVLMLDADRYRGDVLAVDGDVRRLQRFDSPPNEQGISEYYEVWLFTADSGLNPYRIICTSIPDGVSLGESLNPPLRVRATGYFFKRYSYATSGDFHTAPLILARSLEVIASRRPVVADSSSNRGGQVAWMALSLLGLFFLMLIALALTSRSRARSRRAAMDQDTTAGPPDFTWLTESTSSPSDRRQN